jgi:hypothetical protein
MRKGHFKGRVVEVSGTKITIDVKPETRYYTDPITKEKRFIASAFPKPDMPKIGAVVRGIFRRKDIDGTG